MEKKTYKREVAGGQLLFLSGLWVAGIFEPTAYGAAEFLTYPILGWSGAAFALDWRHKQGPV